MIEHTSEMRHCASRWGCDRGVDLQATGCSWTGLTISKAQLQEATDRVQAAGLGDRIQLLFCDYRACQGSFDKVHGRGWAGMARESGYKPYSDVACVIWATLLSKRPEPCV